MPKKVYYTQVTPLPKTIPRQLALDLLHSHEELIRLNPLVTSVESIPAPRDARNDEYYSDWYLIHETMNWGPGMKKKMSFKGVFHDQSWGLQSHTYAPLGTDLRQKYRIGGNQPGEPPEARELGIDTPSEGLYLREDHEISCAVPMTAGFVKKEMKAATAIMVERLTKKAELLEQGKLHAMFEQGRLKTSKPNPDGLAAGDGTGMPNPPSSPAPVPGIMRRESQFPMSPGSPPGDGTGTFGLYSNVSLARQASTHSALNSPNRSTFETKPLPQQPIHGYSELPASMGQLAPQTSQPGFRAELPGDMEHYPQHQQQQVNQHLHSPQQRASAPVPGISYPNNAEIPSPLRVPQRHLSATGNTHGYHVVNTDAPPLPTKSNPDLRASVQSDAAVSAESRSKLASAGHEPDAQRFSRLSLSPHASNDGSTRTIPGAQQSHEYPQLPQRQYHTSLVPQPGPYDYTCPACPFFGDEAAVNHHYMSSHLT